MTVYPSSNDHAALTQAIDDARAGRRDDAVRRLRQIVQAEPTNVDAWVWLGGTSPDANEQRRALERALELAPDNRRAQQGLQWLHVTAPQAFDTPPSAPEPPAAPAVSPGDDRWARAQGATPRHNSLNDIAQRAEAPTQAVEQSAVWASYAPQQQAAAPAQPSYLPPAQPASYEQPTQVMPVQPNAANAAPFPQDASGVAPFQRPQPVIQPRPAPPLPRTEAMRGAPPQVLPRRERHIGANIARWGFVFPLWLFGLGAALTTTAIVIYTLLTDPPFLDTMLSAVVRPFGYRFDPGTEGRIGTLVGAIIWVMLALTVVLGLWNGARWAWVTALWTAVLTFVGAVVLAVLPFFGVVPQVSYALNNPLTQILVGLLIFTFVLLVLTSYSRRAFPRRGNRYDAYER